MAIARAVYNDSDIYVFDDPLSALDAYVGMNLFNEVFNDYLKDKTIIISTHALQYVSYFDRIFYINQGQIKFIGEPKDIENQQFYQEFKTAQENKKNEDNENLSLNMKKRKIFKEEEKKENEIKKNNNFISFKNNLKNIKDKDERQTKSYLLALGMTKYQNTKEQYIPTVSVIEEEKSDIVESKSELSNKNSKRKDKHFFENNLQYNLYQLVPENLLHIHKSNIHMDKLIF